MGFLKKYYDYMDKVNAVEKQSFNLLGPVVLPLITPLDLVRPIYEAGKRDAMKEKETKQSYKK